MQASIFLARLIGPIFLISGASFLLNRRGLKAMATEVMGSMVLVYLFGLIDFVAGLAIVLTHNVWAANWRILITLLGWLLLLRGVVRVLIPERIMSYGAKLLGNNCVYLVSGIVLGVLGLVLCYFGYVA
jgi:hypothetical protein